MKKFLAKVAKVIKYVTLLLKLLYAIKDVLNKNDELEITVNNTKKPG